MKLSGRLVIKKYTPEGMHAEIKLENMTMPGRLLVPGIDPEDNFEDADFEIVLKKVGEAAEEPKAKRSAKAKE